MNIRAQAARLLADLLQHQGSLNASLPGVLRQCNENERPLLQQICYGVMRDQPRLAALAELLLQKPFKRKDYDLYALVLVGLYQLSAMRVAEHAAINETVTAVKQLGAKKLWAKGLINAVLRRYQREQAELEDQLDQIESARYNHPQWFIDKLRHNWPEHWQRILDENNQPAPMVLRVNTTQVSRDIYLQELELAGIDASAGRFSPVAVYLDKPCDVNKLPGFHEGWVSVQDEAAQLAAFLLDLKPGQRVLDACAAPGGKLCHIMETEPDIAHLTGVELEERRAARIEENLGRLNQSCELVIGDASSQDWWDGKPYDRILLDAPCSATGVIRRNPDIKFLRQGEDIARTADLQLAILQNCWQMLAEGGELVYATCSIFPQENARLIARFLKQESSARHLEIDAQWGEAQNYGRQLFPGEQDGFYYARLTKARLTKLSAQAE